MNITPNKLTLIFGFTLLGLLNFHSVSAMHHDPFESVNRGIYKVNKVVDGLYIRPAAGVYKEVMPLPVKSAVSNFFRNVREVPTFANAVLQGEGKWMANAAIRFTINSTLGVFGLFDVAKEMGLKHHREDLGQTLAKWGYKRSAYLVLPLLGPSTVRDTIGRVGDRYLTPSYYLNPKWRNRYFVGQLVNNRYLLFDAEDVIRSAAVDEYALVRNAYLQRRNHLIGNGDAINAAEYNDQLLGEPPD